MGHGPCFLQIIYLVHGSWLKWCTEEASGSRSRRKNLSAFQLYLSLSKPPYHSSVLLVASLVAIGVLASKIILHSNLFFTDDVIVVIRSPIKETKLDVHRIQSIDEASALNTRDGEGPRPIRV